MNMRWIITTKRGQGQEGKDKDKGCIVKQKSLLLCDIFLEIKKKEKSCTYNILHRYQQAYYKLYNHTVLGLNNSRLHLIQVMFDTLLFVLDHFLLLVHSFLDLLAHHLESIEN